MAELSTIQYALIALVFVWSGFVRSGLGFGGAVLSLPFLLLIHNDALLFLPIIALQLIFFSSLILIHNHRAAVQQRKMGREVEGAIDWVYLKKSLPVMIIPKLIGVFGLIAMPANVMGLIIFSIVCVYALSYILDRPFKSKNRLMDGSFLVLGAYVSGTSLIGAPLLSAVFASHVVKEKLRDTLFTLWFILVWIKVAAFVYLDVDLHLLHQLWLLPCAGLGHILGLKLHRRLQSAQSSSFYRFLGVVLLITSAVGLMRIFL
jgi:uncharacterized protein